MSESTESPFWTAAMARLYSTEPQRHCANCGHTTGEYSANVDPARYTSRRVTICTRTWAVVDEYCGPCAHWTEEYTDLEHDHPGDCQCSDCMEAWRYAPSPPRRPQYTKEE